MANTVTIRVYEELNDFIHPSRRKKAFSFTYSGRRTIKDLIESLGIPHTEIDLILINGESVPFNHYPAGGDYISVYPVFESIDIEDITQLRPKPLREVKFVLDVHLGTLSRYLRLAGIDSYYRNDLKDDEIISISLQQRRIILTRDLPLLKNGKVTHGYFIRGVYPGKQFHEVIRHFHLENIMKPFTRCLECNGIIELITDKKLIINKLPSKTLKYFNDFYTCTSCSRIYWKGSHYLKMTKKLEEFLNPSALPFQPSGHVPPGSQE